MLMIIFRLLLLIINSCLHCLCRVELEQSCRRNSIKKIHVTLTVKSLRKVWYDILSTSKNSCFDHATLIRKRNGYQAKVQLNECIEGNIRHLWKLMIIKDGLAVYNDANFRKKAIPFLLFDLDQIDAEQSNQCMSAKLLLAEIAMLLP